MAELPAVALDASMMFFAEHLHEAKTVLAKADTSALAIVLPDAAADHDDWRRSLARDLARAHAPKRVNVVGSDDHAARDDLLAYLGNAPGVTGHYCQTHE